MVTFFSIFYIQQIVLLSWCSCLLWWLPPGSQANTIVGLHVAPFAVRQTSSATADGTQQQQLLPKKQNIEGEESGNAIQQQQSQQQSAAGTPVAPISLKPGKFGG